MSTLFRNRPLLYLLTATLFLLLTPLAVMSLVALDGYRHLLMPELQLKAESVGRLLARKVERAVGLGIPLDRLVGMRPFLDGVMDEAPEIGFVAVSDAGGLVLYAGGMSVRRAAAVMSDTAASDTGMEPLEWIRPVIELVARPLLHAGPQTNVLAAPIRGGHMVTSVAIVAGGENVGSVHVAVPLDYFSGQLEATAFDVLIVLLVALLIAFELLLLVLSVNLLHPLNLARDRLRALREGRLAEMVEQRRIATDLGGLLAALSQAGRQIERWRLLPPRRADTSDPEAGPAAEPRQNLVVVRLLAFLFVVAEELARPFLPVYVESYAVDTPFARPELLVGLLISAFMLVAAVTMAFGGPATERFERRQTFALGAVLASLGLLGTAFAQTYNDLILWRLLSAIGYGLAFVACQGYVIDHTDRTNRARGLAMFTGGIIAADICGPAIGGILANHLGFRATLAIAGATALIAVVAVWWLMDTHRRRARPVQPSFPGALRDLSRSWRFLVLIVFAALPAKFVLAGFLFFQVPLFLTELGASQSEIGRILMLYGITAFVTTPVFAHWADRFEAHGFLVGLGGAVAGLGLLPILLDASVAQIVLAVTLLGLGQAMTLSSLIAVLTRIAHDDIERRGQASILGVFRLLERIGAALGPLCVAWLVAEHGHVAAMAFTGVLVFAGAILFSSLMLMGGYEPVPGADPDLSSDGLS